MRERDAPATGPQRSSAYPPIVCVPFFFDASRPPPSRALIRGRDRRRTVEEIEEPMMREIHSLDKLIDELAKGRPMERVLRT